MNERKFDGKGEVYAKYRPKYPKALFEYLAAQEGLTAGTTVADVGAGTGIFAKQLLKRGCVVYAVEPNEDMLHAGRTALGAHPDITFVSGTAEHTTLTANSVGAVTAAQAFHWFDRALFKKECRRILKPNGKCILVWNDKDEDSPLTAAMAEISKKFCPQFKGFSGGTAHQKDRAQSGFFENGCTMREFENNQTFDEPHFIGRCLSASYALKPEDSDYNRYVRALEELFAAYNQNGILTMPHTTRSYVGRV